MTDEKSVPPPPPNPSQPNSTWWLAEDEGTTGPHQQHAISRRLIDGTLTHSTRACRVREQVWKPLSEWSEFVKIAPPTPPPSPKDSEDEDWVSICVGSIILILAGVWIYNASQSDSPREVCQNFLSAETAEDAEQCTTRSMGEIIRQYKRIEELYPQFDNEEEDADFNPFELTFEKTDPVETNGHYVGCRIDFPDAGPLGESMVMETEFHLRQTGSEWKIDSWEATHVNGESLPRVSVSMEEFWKSIADEMQKQIDEKAVKAPPQPKRDKRGGIIEYLKGKFGPVGGSIALLMLYGLGVKLRSLGDR